MLFFDKAWGVLCGSVAVEPKFILISIGQSILEVIWSNYSNIGGFGLVLVGSLAISELNRQFWNGMEFLERQNKVESETVWKQSFLHSFRFHSLNVSKNLFVAIKVHSLFHGSKSAVKASGQTHLLLAETLRKGWTNDWRHSKRQTTFGTSWKLCLEDYRCFGY